MTNKKVGILTRRAGFNHGSSLQAFAMATFISDAGYDCKVINYDEYSGHPRWKIRPFIENIQWALYKFFPEILRFGKYDYLSIRNSQYKRFNKFEKDYIPLTEKKYRNNRELVSVSAKFDAIVCGSDQIWCPLLYDPVYLFNFLEEQDINTVAYAPSIGIDDIKLIGTEERELMNKVKHLSCREKQGAEMIKKITNRECPIVLDPTLMVSVEKWTELATSIYDIEKEPYILCYFLGKNVHQDYIDELKRKTGYKVLNILMFNRLNPLECDRKITDVGPIEFLNLIKNAAYVCTDSFHGAIFSFIFQRKLSLFERFKNGEKDNQNSRIHTLLRILKFHEALQYDSDMPNINKNIDYATCHIVLKEWQEKSLQYIKNALA